jgi:hypothetical protein
MDFDSGEGWMRSGGVGVGEGDWIGCCPSQQTCSPHTENSGKPVRPVFLLEDPTHTTDGSQIGMVADESWMVSFAPPSVHVRLKKAHSTVAVTFSFIRNLLTRGAYNHERFSMSLRHPAQDEQALRPLPDSCCSSVLRLL